MNNSGILYMKGMNGMESDEEDMEEEEDIWDDTKLNDAYDKALKMANLEVAKRVAMSTNSVQRKKEKSGENSQPQPNSPKYDKQQKSSKIRKAQKNSKATESNYSWMEGMACRAMYSVDGFDYEAIVLTILDDETCVIRYLGYNNTEIVPISSLQPSLGKQARKDQMLEALAEKEEDDSSTHSVVMDNCFTEEPKMREIKEAQTLPKRRIAKNKRRGMDDVFPMPSMAMAMPDVSSMMKEFGQMDMPTPPPPLVGMEDMHTFNDDQALSNMLVSWYMSGYYTGLYHGMKRSKQRQREC